MDRLRPGRLRGLDDPVAQKVALRRGGRADMHGFIRHLDMLRRPIRVRIHRDRFHTQPMRRFHHPARNLAPVRDQDFSEHSAAPPFSKNIPAEGGKLCSSSAKAKRMHIQCTRCAQIADTVCTPISSHPKHAKARLFDRRVQRRRQAQRQHITAFTRVDHPRHPTAVPRHRAGAIAPQTSQSSGA